MSDVDADLSPRERKLRRERDRLVERIRSDQQAQTERIEAYNASIDSGAWQDESEPSDWPVRRAGVSQSTFR